MSKKHHYVSVGLLRLFSDHSGKRVAYLDKRNRTLRQVGVRDVFHEERLNSYRPVGAEKFSDELELEWSRRENTAIPLIRAARRGVETEGLHEAICFVLALHHARSLAVRRAYLQYIAQDFSGIPERVEGLEGAFRSDYGRDAAPGEIQAIADRLVDESRTSNRVFVDTMLDQYHKVFERIHGLHMQRIWNPHREYGFVISDQPLVPWLEPLVFGHGRIPLLQADHVYMPLRRDLAVMVTSKLEEQDVVVNPITVCEMNSWTYQGAERFLAFPPDLDPARSIVALRSWAKPPT